ncbi:MAG: hypothetical protein KGZ70_13405 [Hydrogenophaga sp.]|nr:hypothetical protein [Hydrogenophaga sp.]
MRHSFPPPQDAPVVAENSSQTPFTQRLLEIRKRQASRPAIEAAGRQALHRLFTVAQGDTGQSRRVAAFLLGCYNGDRFPFDLTDFRSLDFELFDDCMAVLAMDAQPRQEVHLYFENGGQRFEEMAKRHAIPDIWRMNQELRQLKGE